MVAINFFIFERILIYKIEIVTFFRASMHSQSDLAIFVIKSKYFFLGHIKIKFG